MNIKIKKLSELSKKDLTRIFLRSKSGRGQISSQVRDLIKKVAIGQNQALISETNKYYGFEDFSLTSNIKEIDSAFQSADKKFIKALKKSIKNITLFNQMQKNKIDQKEEIQISGIFLSREFRPVEKVGIYVPGGNALYPSSLLMTVIPAQIAGCREIIVCTPPNTKGQCPKEILTAAKLLKINKIYKIGGPLGIAAMAYGTQTVPKVDKIYGAGSDLVTEAKIQVSKDIAIDMPAGPSEVFVIADESADPEFIAADLLADAEHGENSAPILLTTSPEIAKKTKLAIEKQIENLSTKERIKKSIESYGLLAIVNSLSEAVDFCNYYAPEHLIVCVKNPKNLVRKINNAGSIFIGKWTSKSAGDYATGANHILPTGGFAKSYGSLSVESFGKYIEIQNVPSKKELSKLRSTIETLAEVENLPAHKNSTSIRFEEK